MTIQYRFRSAIIKFIASSDNYQPAKPRRLAELMAVEDNYYADFRQEVKDMLREGVLTEASGGRIDLPDMPRKLTGVYRFNPRGFGFIVPDDANSQGDLFIPPGDQGGAMNGDRVRAEAFRAGKRDGRTRYRGRVVEILDRAAGRFVGVLAQDERRKSWRVEPQGKAMRDPIVIADIPPGSKHGDRVVVEITRYPSESAPAAGVIVETLEAPTEAKLEMLSIIREFDVPSEFPPEIGEEARRINDSFDEAAASVGREDMTGMTVVTIDPDEARDFDDAISIEPAAGGRTVLGVHIADVSAFVAHGSVLDAEARLRGNSTYLPRHVVPMLPEILSNGLCSLQEGVPRLVKSAFIEYDADGQIVSTRFANGVIRSRKRLTYRQAQGILDGRTGGYPHEVVKAVCDMKVLAQAILQRRRRAGMIHLDLPETEIVFDDDGKPVDVEPADTSFTHRIIEMFMVEANEAVARLLDGRKVPFIRRIHPVSPGVLGKDSAAYIKACGYKIPTDLSRHDIQALVEKVHGRPESYPVNLALLRTLEQAEYSLAPIGHYALASGCYCHFTSPIRRYADLCVHRQLDDYLHHRPDEREEDYEDVARHCCVTERRSSSAEREARTLITLMILREKLGEVFDGVVTSVVASGIFAELLAFQIDGLIKLEDLGGEGRWSGDPGAGAVVQGGSGRRISLGQSVKVRIVAVDLPKRRLDLRLEETGAKPAGAAKGAKQGKAKAAKGKSRRGPAKAKSRKRRGK